jgi:hypothetical protein
VSEDAERKRAAMTQFLDQVALHTEHHDVTRIEVH